MSKFIELHIQETDEVFLVNKDHIELITKQKTIPFGGVVTMCTGRVIYTKETYNSIIEMLLPQEIICETIPKLSYSE